MLMLVEEVAVVCLQAQRVTGLPAAVEELGCQCHRRRLGLGQEQEPPVCARASASGGVAAFHNEVLLLHCARGAALSSITVTINVSVSVSVCGRSPYRTAHGHGDTSTVGVFQVDLAGELEYMMMHSPKVLSFVLSGEAAGAVLTLALHQRRRIVTAHTTRARCCSSYSCLPLPLPVPGPGCCLRMRMNNKHSQKQEQQQQSHNSDDESAGFITIEKHGTITRRPPSDNLLTTDEEEDDKPGIMETELELDGDSSSRVEDEFLAMLELAKRPDSDSDSDSDSGHAHQGSRGRGCPSSRVQWRTELRFFTCIYPLYAALLRQGLPMNWLLHPPWSPLLGQGLLMNWLLHPPWSPLLGSSPGNRNI